MAIGSGMNGGHQPAKQRIVAVLEAAPGPLSVPEIARALRSDGGGPRVSELKVESVLKQSSDVAPAPGGRWWLSRVGTGDQPSSRPTTQGLPKKLPAAHGRRLDHVRRVELPSTPAAWEETEPGLYAWQAAALAEWGANGGRGIVQAVTGSGKTRVGIAAVRRSLKEGGRAVVLVPGIELMRQWRDALAVGLGIPASRIGQLGGGHRDSLVSCDVLVSVVKSASAHLPDQIAKSILPVLLVADEAHRYGADTFSPAIAASYTWTLGLSATPERGGDDAMHALVFPAIGPVVFEYDHGAALADGVISDFEVSFIGFHLSGRERSEYEELSEELRETQLDLYQRYRELREARYFFATLDELYEETGDPTIRRFQSRIYKRRQLLQDANERFKAVDWLIEELPASSKALFFHETIANCEEIAERLNAAGVPARAYHSELTKTERADVLRRFARGSLRAVVAVRTLDEGIDVPDADFAVIAAGSKVPRQGIQRVGRVLRRSKSKTSARILVLYASETVEDPRKANGAGAFAAEIERVDRAVWFEWPNDRQALLNFVRPAEAVQRA